MRHLHAADAEFLEAFRDRGQSAGVNAVSVISRADEIGGGRVDAMVSARAVARRYRTEPVLRGLCQNVVAVAGLLAETARTLRQTEFTALAALAALPREELDAALLTADRFLAPDGDLAGLAGEERARLLRRFGVFGLRLGTVLIRQGSASPAALAAELLDRSGLHDLQQVLDAQFVQRRDVLKARSALLAVLSVLDAAPPHDGGRLAADVERIFASAHEFAELRLLSALRSRAVALPGELAADAEVLLGEHGRRRRRPSGVPTRRPARRPPRGGRGGARPLAASRGEPHAPPRRRRRLPRRRPHLRGPAGRPDPGPRPRPPPLTRGCAAGARVRRLDRPCVAFRQGVSRPAPTAGGP
jgi:hypothetical protein